jgi:hypothetical protein
LPGSAEAFDHARQRRWCLWSGEAWSGTRERISADGFEPKEQAFKLFMLLQQHGHHEDLERPRTRQIHPSLDVELGAVEETIKGSLIVLTQGAPKGGPGTAFIFDELAEGWKRSTHNISPPTIRALYDERRG